MTSVSRIQSLSLFVAGRAGRRGRGGGYEIASIGKVWSCNVGRECGRLDLKLLLFCARGLTRPTMHVEVVISGVGPSTKEEKQAPTRPFYCVGAGCQTQIDECMLVPD